MEVTRGRIIQLNIMLLGYPMNNYHMLFILSGLIRMAAILFFLPAVQEEDAQPTKAVFGHAIKTLMPAFLFLWGLLPVSNRKTHRM